MDLHSLSRVCDMVTLNTKTTKVFNRSKYLMAVLQDEGLDKIPHFHIFSKSKSFNVKYSLNGELVSVKWGEPEYDRFKNEINENIRDWLLSGSKLDSNRKTNIEEVLYWWNQEVTVSHYAGIIIEELERLKTDLPDLDVIQRNIESNKPMFHTKTGEEL